MKILTVIITAYSCSNIQYIFCSTYKVLKKHYTYIKYAACRLHSLMIATIYLEW